MRKRPMTLMTTFCPVSPYSERAPGTRWIQGRDRYILSRKLANGRRVAGIQRTTPVTTRATPKTISITPHHPDGHSAHGRWTV